MRLLLLSFYFRPDLSAGSFRATALVDSLLEQLPAGSQIDVITTLPNRYQAFAAEAPVRESHAGVTIHRVALPDHESGMLDQSRAFLVFAREARRLIGAQRYDLVFATSSRLMTARLGAEVARRIGAPLYLDIRDLFADTIKDVLKGPLAVVAGFGAGLLERHAFSGAARINVVSGGFIDYFRARYPTVPLSNISNGVDDEFLAAAPGQTTASPRAAGSDTVTALYAGNIGEGQGLHHIIPALAQRVGARLRFRVIGGGGRLEALKQALTSAQVENVEVLPPVVRSQLIAAYRSADVLFLHLNDYPAFHRVLPSKLFEYAAMGKPIWAGVAGFAARFVESEIPNAGVFPPGDGDAALRALATLRMEDAPRTRFLAEHSRRELSRRLAADVLSLLSPREET